MAKTDETLTTITLTCPVCNEKAPIEFHREIDTVSLPFITLNQIGSVIGECKTCGQTFPYSNASKLYEYMDKTGESYKRSYLTDNLKALAIPTVIIIVLIIAIAAIVPQLPNLLGNGGAGGDSDTGASPLLMTNFSYVGANQTAYATFRLSSNDTPVDMMMLKVSVQRNGTLLYANVWHYNNNSITWTNRTGTGSTLGPGQTAKVAVDVSRYHFNNSEKIQLKFQIANTLPYVNTFVVSNATGSGNGTMDNGPVGNYTILTGHVYMNNTAIIGATLRITSNASMPTTIVTDNWGSYSIKLTPNSTYSINVTDPGISTLIHNDSRVTMVRNTTLDIQLHL